MADKTLTLDHFRTLRKDNWWVQPLIVVVGLGGFAIYSTWAALQNAYYYAPPYLSPFYSPCISANCAHVTLPLDRLVVEPWSPAFLILWDSRRLSRHLLLLSQSLLSLVFSITAGLRRARRRQKL